MDRPVRILSDLHLGHKVSRIGSVAALRPLLENVGTVIFNGDTYQELSKNWATQARERLAQLISLCDEMGVTPIFLPGNHDPGWDHPGWVGLADGKIVVTHGDALLKAGSPWKREILAQPERVQEIWQRHANAANDLDQRMSVAREIARELRSLRHSSGRKTHQRVWDAMMPPIRLFKMLESWSKVPGAGSEFGRTFFPAAEVVIVGHFHITGSWLLDGIRVIATGSFMTPGQAHWVDWDHGLLSRGVVRESDGAFRKGEILNVWQIPCVEGSAGQIGTRGRDRTADQSGVSGPLYR